MYTSSSNLIILWPVVNSYIIASDDYVINDIHIMCLECS